MHRCLSRREFLGVSSRAAALATTAALRPLPAGAAESRSPASFRGTLCIFSKPVPQLNWSELAAAARGAGFQGVDLTVRSGGHVLPARVEIDLPKAVASIRGEGLEVPMITTEITDAQDPIADPILRTAKDLSIPYIKLGYYHYKLSNVWKERDEAGQKFRRLVELAAKYERQLGYHNHGHYIGAPIWDIAQVIELCDPRYCGFYFDLGHCTTDGGESGWEIATNLVMPRLKMVAVKDFVWTKLPSGRLKARTCPLGQGFVPWREFLKALAKSDFHGPISLHEEYEIPGSTDEQGRALSREGILKVMAEERANLTYLKSLLEEAYAAPRDGRALYRLLADRKPKYA